MTQQFSHIPVLLEETIDLLRVIPDGIYVDATAGGGGHSCEILSRLSSRGVLVCIDQDIQALEAAYSKLAGRIEKLGSAVTKASTDEKTIFFYNTNFENIDMVCKKLNLQKVDGILMDIGVSSFQLDEGKRGFSCQKDALLDMRMNLSSTKTARDIVNSYSKEQLEKVIANYGEERWASRIAEFIVKHRAVKSIDTTFELVEIIKAAIPNAARRDGPHPAKRTFQALRIEVNDELGVLERAIDKSVELLNDKGRICVITFHSLEDRIVKNKFNSFEKPCTCPPDFPVCICGRKPLGRVITKKPIEPGQRELERNPRARSAKLRVFEKAYS